MRTVLLDFCLFSVVTMHETPLHVNCRLRKHDYRKVPPFRGLEVECLNSLSYPGLESLDLLLHAPLIPESPLSGFLIHRGTRLSLLLKSWKKEFKRHVRIQAFEGRACPAQPPVTCISDPQGHLWVPKASLHLLLKSASEVQILWIRIFNYFLSR